MAVQQMSNTRKFMGKPLFLLELQPSGPFIRKKKKKKGFSDFDGVLLHTRCL